MSYSYICMKDINLEYRYRGWYYNVGCFSQIFPTIPTFCTRGPHPSLLCDIFFWGKKL